jgi:mono/diheme cytochrome c family protein
MTKVRLFRSGVAPALFCWVGIGGLPALCADLAAGKAVFEAKCQKCHGDDGRGNPSMAKLLKMKQPFTPLGTAEVQTKSDAELKQIAMNGVRTSRAEMKPVKGGLSDAEASVVVGYLRTFK